MPVFRRENCFLQPSTGLGLAPSSALQARAELSQQEPAELGTPPLAWAPPGAEKEGGRTVSERGRDARGTAAWPSRVGAHLRMGL